MPSALKLASYRLVALTYNGNSPDLKAVVSSARTAFIYGEQAQMLMATYRLLALASSTRSPDMLGVVAAARTSFIVMTPTATVTAGRMAFIIEQLESGTPTYVTQAQALTTQHTDYRPVAETISFESVKQVAQLTTVTFPPMPFPWSYTRVAEMRQLVLQSRPITAQSYESVKQVSGLTVSTFNYLIPGEVISYEAAAQSVLLVVQSLDIPYQPTSGEFVRQQFALVLQEAGVLPIWTSPAYMRQVFALAVQKRPIERLPRSITRVAEVTTQAVVKRPIEPLPRSTEYVAEVTTQVVQPTDMPVPVGVIHSAEVVQLTTVATEMPAAVGMVQDAQLALKVVQARPLPLHISTERVPSLRTLVVYSTQYNPPDEMVFLHTAQFQQQVMQQAAYPPPTLFSYNMVPQLAVMFMTLPPASVYPDPETVYEESRKAYVPQLTELVTARLPVAMPKSQVPVPQLQMLTSQRADYPTPEEMATSGVFVTQAIEHVAMESQYPSTGVPASELIANQIVEQLAVEADYPNAHLPVNFAIVPQVIEHVATSDEYPDPADLSAPINVLQVAEHISLESGYPDAGTLHSPVLALQLVEQLSMEAGYPDKDIPQSILRVAQLSQQAAFSAAYPNKDVPQSRVRINQVCHHVARRDLTMYQLPTPPRKHRVRIVCRFVY